MFIEVTDNFYYVHLINVKDIAHVFNNRGNANITLSSGETIFTIESYAEICSKIKKEV